MLITSININYYFNFFLGNTRKRKCITCKTNKTQHVAHTEKAFKLTFTNYFRHFVNGDTFASICGVFQFKNLGPFICYFFFFGTTLKEKNANEKE